MDAKLATACVFWGLGVVCLALAIFGGSNLAPRPRGPDDRFRFDLWLYRRAPRFYIATQRVEFVLGAAFLGGLGWAILKYGR